MREIGDVYIGENICIGIKSIRKAYLNKCVEAKTKDNIVLTNGPVNKYSLRRDFPIISYTESLAVRYYLSLSA